MLRAQRIPSELELIDDVSAFLDHHCVSKKGWGHSVMCKYHKSCRSQFTASLLAAKAVGEF